jgi:hypothetical protein
MGDIYGPPWWTDEHRERVREAFEATDMCRTCCRRVPKSEIDAGLHEHPPVMD